MAVEDPLNGAPRQLERRIIQCMLTVSGREARRDQQRIAAAQWYLQALRQPHDHGAGRARASGLYKAEMAWRYIGFEGEFELAHPAALPPFLELAAETFLCSDHRHQPFLARVSRYRHYLRGNRPPYSLRPSVRRAAMAPPIELGGEI